MDPASILHPWDPWADVAEAPPGDTACKTVHRRRKHYGRHYIRPHRRRSTRAVDRVLRRRHHRRRVHAWLKAFSVPALALVPASVAYIEYPMNLVIAPSLGVMGLVLMFGRHS